MVMLVFTEYVRSRTILSVREYRLDEDVKSLLHRHNIANQ
ncbi:hypothetical protein PEC301899_28700 [Pectobacterium carotovorum subsp. carotovorum]|nr:hypothetical protein PEC301899_28700 [Pectobacterium carotovorum subsp. carotovorum]